MFQNNNGVITKKLAKRSLKFSRNYIAIIAIVLATLLFTSLFTILGSLQISMQDSNMRKMGTSAHAGVKHITMQEYEKLSQDSAVNDISYSIIIGSAEGVAFKKLPTEVRWGEEKYAQWTFNFPTLGEMPQEEKEFATSKLVLDALGIPYELGQKIDLSIQTDSGVITDTFILCGIWDGDTVSYRQTLWLSRDYTDKVAPLADISLDGLSNLSTGYLDSVILFPSAWNIEKQVNDLVARYSLNAPTGVNTAYGTAEIDFQNLLGVILALIVIFTAGYLLIYNIFYISVAQDIRSYGLLKTVGTTSKQIRKIVYHKAIVLSCTGIPLGLLLGWPIGRLLVPFIINILGENMRVVTTINPLIFIVAAIFSLLTIYLSCIRPARLAAKVSPIEAVRYTEKDSKTDRKKKTKRVHRVTAQSMALSNLGRNRKKVIVVVMSFALSLVLLNSTYTYIHSFDFDKFVSGTSVSDFSVADATIINSASPFNTAGISDNFVNQVQTLKGIENYGNIYLFAPYQPHDETILERLKEYINAPDDVGTEYTNLMVRKQSAVNTYGFDDWPANWIEVLDGTVDNEKWKNGEGIYVTPLTMFEDGTFSLYQPGDMLEVDYGNENIKKYEVLAIVKYPEAFKSPMALDLGLEYLLPSSELVSNIGKTVYQPMRTIFDVEETHLSSAENWLENYCSNVDTGLDFWSRKSMQKTFQNLIVMYNAVGGALCVILAIIGVLNFINSMVTSILTRQREIAMLQSVGMTGKQTKDMLIFEGVGYAICGLFLSIVLSSIASMTVIRMMGAELYYFTWKFTLMPIILCIIPLILITVLVPLFCYRKMSKNSIVQRLREIE